MKKAKNAAAQSDRSSLRCDELARVKREFAASSVSVASWARAKNFKLHNVYKVLHSPTSCSRGERAAIAIALGLKRSQAQTIEQLDQRLLQSAVDEASTGGAHDVT